MGLCHSDHRGSDFGQVRGSNLNIAPGGPEMGGRDKTRNSCQYAGIGRTLVLNVGLELGILSSALFTMLVLMALVTTFMTAPLLSVTKVVGLEEQRATAGTLASSQ